MTGLVKWTLGATLILLGVGAVIVTVMIYFPIWLFWSKARD